MRKRSTSRSDTVLIVDDDDGIRRSLARLLRLEGYATAEASNGMEALEYLRSHPAPRLILLDLMMPLMNGWQFSEAKQRDPALSKIPVAVISASREMPNAAASIPAVAYLEKPFDLEDLLRALASAAPPPEPEPRS